MAITTNCVLRTALFIAVIVGLGGLIGVTSMSGEANPWYAALPKSSLNPPGWVFGVVWPILYTLMAVAAAWLYQEKHWDSFRLFMTQLVFNYAWSFVFFKFEQVGWGFFWIVLILVLAIGWVKSLYELNKPLAYMQLPYIWWLIFAAYLSGTILFLT